MLSALLLSLLLHGLLLFFIRFAQPAWKNFSGGNIPLQVILEKTPAEIPKPSAIAEAGQNSMGTAKTGVQANNRFPEKTLTATRLTPAEEFKTDIPKTFTGKEILTVKKSAHSNKVESAPDLLVTQTPPPENPESKEKPFAPAPSVEKPVASVAPSAEKLVSAMPVPGEKQEKIVFAEPVQEKTSVEKTGNVPDVAPPVKVEEPKPIKIEAIKPVKIAESKPVENEKVKPVNIEEPKPVKVAEPAVRPINGGSSDVFRATPDYRIPGIAGLSIDSIKKFADDNDRKIKFGERRKTIGLKEQDFRYAMYAESVRLKLERIGQFNYPAAAARDNLNGTLSVVLTIRSDGSLENFSIIQPSVYQVLNSGAERIVRLSAPFSPLPDNIRQDTDVLSIKINWSFSSSNQSLD